MSRSHDPKLSARRTGAAFLSACIVAVAMMGTAYAAGAGGPTSDELRRTGAACEQADGFLRALNPGAQAGVAQINAARRRVYEQRAGEQNVELAAAALIFAEQIRREPSYVACPN